MSTDNPDRPLQSEEARADKITQAILNDKNLPSLPAVFQPLAPDGVELPLVGSAMESGESKKFYAGFRDEQNMTGWKLDRGKVHSMLRKMMPKPKRTKRGLPPREEPRPRFTIRHKFFLVAPKNPVPLEPEAPASCIVCGGPEPCSHDFDKMGKDLEDLGRIAGTAQQPPDTDLTGERQPRA